MKQRRQAGFTLVELMVTLAIVTFVLAAASQMFVSLLTNFKQQSRIAESNIGASVGLEMLRRDIESAGYGLPWNMGGVTYNEAVGTPASNYNDSTSNPPRALASGNNITHNGFNEVDYLVIKSIAVARNEASRKSTVQTRDAGGNEVKRAWAPAGENLSDTDQVIVASLSNTSSINLIGSAQYNNTAGLKPTDITTAHIIYGIDPDTNLRFPFNRADYYLSNNNVPPRCAPGTGVLVKAVVSQADGSLGAEMPILDCVASVQVVYRLDTDGNGTIDSNTDDVSGLNAGQIRQQGKEVRVYLLAHEGQRDPTYSHSPTTLTVGEFGLGKDVDISGNLNYRWKVYRVVGRPSNGA